VSRSMDNRLGCYVAYEAARLGTLLEEPDPGAPPLEIEDDAIVVPFSPFQLLTVLVE